jgi:hypothetical protein
MSRRTANESTHSVERICSTEFNTDRVTSYDPAVQSYLKHYGSKHDHVYNIRSRSGVGTPMLVKERSRNLKGGMNRRNL